MRKAHIKFTKYDRPELWHITDWMDFINDLNRRVANGQFVEWIIFE